MKKTVIAFVFAFFAFAATQAQNPVKSATTTAPQFEKTMPDVQPAPESKTVVEKKKDDCNGKDMKKCGTKANKGCCKDKSSTKKEATN